MRRNNSNHCNNKQQQPQQHLLYKWVHLARQAQDQKQITLKIDAKQKSKTNKN